MKKEKDKNNWVFIPLIIIIFISIIIVGLLIILDFSEGIDKCNICIESNWTGDCMEFTKDERWHCENNISIMGEA